MRAPVAVHQAHYLVPVAGKPEAVAATAWHGVLWNNTTLQPLFDPSLIKTLSATEQTALGQVIESLPATDPRTLIKMAKRQCFERDARHDAGTRLAVRAEAKKNFYPLAQTVRHPLVKKSVIRAPSNLPLPYKLATGGYEFYPDEVRELTHNTDLLKKHGKHAVLTALHEAGFIDPDKYRPIPGQKDTIQNDPFALTAQWYGIQSTTTLEHMANFWGGIAPLMKFAVARASWSHRTVKHVLTQLAAIDTPSSEAYDRAIWRDIFSRQLKQPYKPKTDLLRLYPQMDEVQDFAKKSNIALGRCENDRLIAFAFTAYPDIAAHPVIAAYCKQLRLPARAYNEAVATLDAVSAQDNIPNVRIDGTQFGLPGQEIVKVRKDDPLILFAGAMANCCGHIGGGRKKMGMVTAMVTNPDVGCYILRDKVSHAVFGKTAVWLAAPQNGRRDLVINLWHDRTMLGREKLAAIAKAIAVTVKASSPEIGAVYMGENYRRPHFPLLDNSAGTIAPLDPKLRTKDTNMLYLIR